MNKHKSYSRKPSRSLKASFQRLNDKECNITTTILPLSLKALKPRDSEIDMELQLDEPFMMNYPPDPKGQKIADLIFAIYGKEAKQDKPLSDKLRGFFKRKFKEDDVEKELRRATKLQRQVSISVCPPEASPISAEEIAWFRGEIEKFIKGVYRVIAAYDDGVHGFSVAKKTYSFIHNWNSLVDSLNGMFLQNYGLIQKDDLIMIRVHTLACALKKIQKCKSVPRAIKYLKRGDFEHVMSTSDRSYRAVREYYSQDIDENRRSMLMLI